VPGLTEKEITEARRDGKHVVVIYAPEAIHADDADVIRGDIFIFNEETLIDVIITRLQRAQTVM
jgi:hypothetical protein